MNCGAPLLSDKFFAFSHVDFSGSIFGSGAGLLLSHAKSDNLQKNLPIKDLISEQCSLADISSL